MVSINSTLDGSGSRDVIADDAGRYHVCLNPDEHFDTVRARWGSMASDPVQLVHDAANPDAAIRLIDWLVSPDRLRRHAEQTGLLPVANDTVARDNAVLAASGAVEANKLAERARYR